ncbi:hypothetical protein F4821DRAFT_271700 [Hypoxylon rubiginosum]|uniref:Uncharacterized protein n=1 Tax=Hypoxylon rubiginosum TaxID=110542 RepID=A0ACC0CSY0_9PEZI|nr:hypothetical protein F4821DRAFT_271700 [Hypoxylon rubiginosum]
MNKTVKTNFRATNPVGRNTSPFTPLPPRRHNQCSRFNSCLTSSTGWKKAAKVNCVVLLCISITLAGCLIAAVTQAGGIQKALFFYRGDCDGNVARVNTVLHLLINIISTLVVLNSPSREEVNKAHVKGSWLDIGVPSVRNVIHISKFKTWSWVVLFLSSIPIHVLFNSTIFQTDYRGSEFHLTIASEGFINQHPYFLPGASLFLPNFQNGYGDGSEYYDYSSFSLSNYTDTRFGIAEKITNIATNAHSWTKLGIEECKREYITCSGIKNHGDLVLVADKSGGWEMWHLNYNQSILWDRYLPSHEPNHLFFDTSCHMQAGHYTGDPGYCDNNCLTALVGDRFWSERDAYYQFDIKTNVSIGVPVWRYSFIWNDLVDVFNRTYPHYINGSWVGSYDGSSNESDYYSPYALYYTSALVSGAHDLSIKYCLARPIDRICQVALSPTLLTGVTICVAIKTCMAILVTITLVHRKQTPLVTPGDATASFIEEPDLTTTGLCTFGHEDIRKVLKAQQVLQGGRTISFIISGTRHWYPLRKRRGTVVPKSVWWTSYLLFAAGIAVCAFFLRTEYKSHMLGASFLESAENAFANASFTFFEGVLLVNSPQLLLSLCYLAYNGLFTRLQAAREWALFSEKYQPLRVTDPQGDQFATYRLQLPYKYSLPLIAVSITLHWLLSNIIYLFVSIGGAHTIAKIYMRPDPSLPPSTGIAVGFSSYALLAMLIVSCLLIIIPVLLSLKRLSPNMVDVGNNSFALAAACHVSGLTHAAAANRPEHLRVPDTTDSSSALDYFPTAFDTNPAIDIEMQQLRTTHLPPSRQSLASERLGSDRTLEDDSSDSEEWSLFRKLARSKIRWGVVQMPPEWYTDFDHESFIEHLSFGVEEDNVQSPVSGRMYA